MIGWKSHMARIARDSLQPQRFRLADKDAKDPFAKGQGPDRVALIRRESHRNEVSEPPVRSDDSQRAIACVGQFDSQLDDPLQHDRKGEVRREDERGLE